MKIRDEKIIEKVIKSVFANSTLEKHERFSTGLVSPTFKVFIKNPTKVIVTKFTKLKREKISRKNNKILNYLNEKSISVPKVFFEGVRNKKFITLMEFLPGDVGSEIYRNSKNNLKKKILVNFGRILKNIHNLKIPSFWSHQKHEIKNKKEWKAWTKLRIDKYLKFFKRKLTNYKLLEEELNVFWDILKEEKIDLVPLHWDFHLHNVNVNSKGDIVGVFDFDNAMKGHSLSDIGQAFYWMIFEMDDPKSFGNFLKGYKNNFSKKELKLIQGYFLLHLLAVSRSIWFRKNSLEWIIEKHKNILDDFFRGKINLEKISK